MRELLGEHAEIGATEDRGMHGYENSRESVAFRRRWIDTIEDTSRFTPDVFRDQAYEAASMVEALDADPTHALEDVPTRRFVDRLTRVGFVQNYQNAMRSPQFAKYAAGSRASLPRWLQPEFLEAQGIQTWPLPPKDRQGVEDAYRRFLARNRIPLQASTENGEYYGPEIPYRPTPYALHFKMYIEGRSLEEVLHDGRWQQAYTRMTHDPSGLRHLKLHDRERLVLYFKSSILTAGPYVEDVLSKYGVPHRGPAQDVDRVQTGATHPVLKSDDSNDGALRENPYHWDKYNPHPYQPQSFMATYLRQCALMGKSPTDPYRTSFITMYMNDGDPRLDDNSYMQEALNQAAPYPLVIRPAPRFPLPIAKP